MYYLGYLSSSSWPLDQAALKSIVEKSKGNNLKLQVTGILLYIDGSILQVLEGEKQTVENLFQKIRIDRRHTAVTKIIDGNLEKRYFPDWSMAFRSLSLKESNDLKQYLYLHEGGLEDLEKRFEGQSNSLLIFLKSFYLGDIGII